MLHEGLLYLGELIIWMGPPWGGDNLVGANCEHSHYRTVIHVVVVGDVEYWGSQG